MSTDTVIKYNGPSQALYKPPQLCTHSKVGADLRRLIGCSCPSPMGYSGGHFGGAVSPGAGRAKDWAVRQSPFYKYAKPEMRLFNPKHHPYFLLLHLKTHIVEPVEFAILQTIATHSS